MADSTILNLPVAVSADGTEYFWGVQGGTDKRFTGTQIANAASGFVPTSRAINAGTGLSGGGTLASDVTLNFAPAGLSAATTMAVTDSFVINSDSTPKIVTFPLAMQAIGGLTVSPALNLVSDKLMVLRAADGLIYYTTPSAIGTAAGNVPAGGTTGQALIKASSTDYDTVWGTLAITVAGLSVVGNATNVSAPSADITAASDNQILRRSGSTLGFGSIDLSQSAAVGVSVLGATNGGTGLSSFTQGDIIYSSASNTLAALAKNTSATRYLSNTGTSNNPAWAQVDLSNGVTGNLPVTNLNSGTSASASTYWRGDGTWASVSAAPAGSDTQLQFNNSGALGASANLTWVSPALTIGVAGSTTGQLKLTGSTSGTITIQGQAAAGTYNFNLPTAAGTSGYPLLSAGGGASPMTFGQLNLASAVTGNLPVTNLNSGTSASSSTYWRGDGTWATPAGTGANTALSNLASVAINTTLLPGSNDGAALGSGTLSFSDLFLASGGVINFNNGNYTLTHSAGLLTASGAFASDTHTITSTSASALAVGRQGATDPVLKVNANTASVATGLSITGAAAAGGVAIAAISSGTNENLTIDAKGSGTITLGGTSTGAITLTRATTVSSSTTSTSTSTGALIVTGGLGVGQSIFCNTFSIDTNAYWQLQAGDPFLAFDSNDYMTYTRSTNTWSVVFGATTRWSLNSSGTIGAVGFGVTSYSRSWTSFTVDPTLGNYQYTTNNASSVTITAPSVDCAVDIYVVNGASAGAITFSGFTQTNSTVTGTYATTNGNKYILSIRRINSVSTYSWLPMQ